GRVNARRPGLAAPPAHTAPAPDRLRAPTHTRPRHDPRARTRHGTSTPPASPCHEHACSTRPSHLPALTAAQHHLQRVAACPTHHVPPRRARRRPVHLR